MSVTIDSLQIEIQSSSANAAKGIHDLSTALAGLKSNGKITTAVNNLNNLRKALHSFSNIPSNASKILSLAQSLAKLKSVGSVTSIGTGLTKLATSLKTLDTVSVDKEKIDKIADSLSSLSQVKAGGINTMMNGLMKLGKVTKSLDDDTINAFAERIEKLTEKLKPLSDKMTTIQAGLKGINSAAKGAGSAIKQTGEEVDGATVNLSGFIYIIQEAVQWLQQAIQKFSEFMAEAIEWDGIAARFGRGFGSQAQEVYTWIQRLNEEMGINIQQFMKYSSVYSTMLTGFGVAMEDATKMALGYTELTYDIWAGYNDIYKNFDDAAEAVKSAIAGEVEPIRRAGFTIVEATLKQTAANHGLEISLENATEAQKSYLRYLTLVDQAHAQGLVGTYAKELQTAEGLMRTLSQQTKSLTQAFGSLFLPILVKIVPYLQAFVELLTDIIHRIAALFGVTIQGVDWSGYNSGVGDAVSGTDDLTGSVGEATDAIKELKNATIGIDELNVISPPSSSGSGAAGDAGDAGFGDLGVDSLWDESVFAEIGTQIDELKRKLEGWLPVIATVGAALGTLGILGLLKNIGEAISKMDILSKVLSTIVVATVEAALVFTFADNYLEEGKLMDLVGQALTTAGAGYILYKGFGKNGFKGAALAMAVSVAAQLAAITMNLADGGVELTDPELWIQMAMTTLTAGAGGLFFFKKIEAIGAKKGAVLGTLIGLSLSLGAITAGEITAEGGLTFESAMTGLMAAAAGAASGAQLFKYLGKDTKKGLLIGASASLALSVASVTATTEDAFGANLMDTITSAVAMGATGAGIGTAISPGIGTAIGFAIGAVVSLAISGISALFSDDTDVEVESDSEKEAKALRKLEKELAERFGKIELTMSEMEVFVDNVMAIPRNVTIDMAGYEMTVSVTAALEFYAIEKEKLKSLEDSVEKALQEIDHLNLKVSLGIEVDPEEYKAAVESFLSASQGLLDQHYLTASVALTVLDLDSSTSNSLSGSLSEFYTANTAKLTELGNKLRDTISSAFVDGEWIPEKLNEAMELQAEIQEILTMVSDAKYEAKLKSIKLDLTGADITQDSFNEAMARLQEAVDEQLGNLDEIRVEALSIAILEYNANIDAGMTKAEAQKIYDQQVAAIEEAYRQGKVEVSFGAIDLGLDTLQEQFKKELAEFDPSFAEILADALVPDSGMGGYVTKDNTYANARLMYDEMIASYEEAARAATSKTERKAIEEILKAMTPSLEDYAQVARDAYSAGKSVPEEVSKGLNDAAEIAALTGNRDAINYLIGKGFTTDKTFLNTLATVENAGKGITGAMADGFLTNTKVVYDAATGTAIGIKDTLTGNFTKMTPTLKENLKTMGMDLSVGLEEGVETKKPSLWKKIRGWGGGVLDTLKEVFEINSPSKATQRMGEQLAEGLTMKLNISTLKDKLSGMWDKAKSWWNGSKGSLKSYTPSIGSIKDKLSSAWSSAKTWWDKSKSKLSTYTPSIGSVKDKLSSAWSSAKTWWSKSKGSLSYTPTIGSIKSKLQSAWNTAKTWWSKNVKLSIPSLGLKLTYSTSGLSKLTKAAMKALGLPGLPKLSFAEHGGIFDVGSLIWAGERGPEVMATAAGGKTGVMNVQQMQDAVYEGVYAAVVAAMRATGGGEGQAVNVYLDGRQVAASVEKRQRERGANIMGNQVYNFG